MTTLKRRALNLLRVRERPDPPPAAGPTLDVFRASRRYLALRRVEWVLTQMGALVGILFSLILFGRIDLPFLQFGDLEAWVSNLSIQTPVVTLGGTDLVFLLESFAITGYLFQLVGSGLLLTLNWEMRWYMVSDESLRIREGLVRIREQTMTVANIQNMRIRQGPLLRMFGLAELEVHTAGGGGKATEDDKSASRNLHVGHFRGLEDAWALRDRLRGALARHRASGLGDPDEDRSPSADEGRAAPRGVLVLAAETLLAEARRLRATIREE